MSAPTQASGGYPSEIVCRIFGHHWENRGLVQGWPVGHGKMQTLFWCHRCGKTEKR